MKRTSSGIACCIGSLAVARSGWFPAATRAQGLPNLEDKGSHLIEDAGAQGRGVTMAVGQAILNGVASLHALGVDLIKGEIRR